MPMYSTRVAPDGAKYVYTAQRPSDAACKAYTSHRKRTNGPDDLKAIVFVTTEGRRAQVAYEVTYELVDDAFLGSFRRPVARKISEDTEVAVADQNGSVHQAGIDPATSAS